MGLVRAVALNTFREAVRDRVFYNLLLFAVLLVGASLVIGQLAAGQDVKIIKDLGLAASLLFGVGIAVFIGIQLVAREVERRSVHATLSKPVSRPTFLLGKYVGLLLTLGVNIVVMAVALFAVLAVYGALTPPGVQAIWTAPALDPRLLAALALIYVELAVVTAIALLFSTYSSALLSATFTSAIWVAGHFVGDLRAIEQVGASGATAWGMAGLVGAAEPRAVRHQGGSGAWHAGPGSAGPGIGRLRHRVQRRHVVDRSRDLPATGLQVTRRLPWLIGASVLLASAMPLQTMTIRLRPERELPAVLYLQTPAVAKRVALSFDMLAADLYWMRALQDFGATRLRTAGPRTFENLYPFLDLATALDPRFVVAYRFGAIFLSEAPPGGPGRPDLAVRLLEKGVAATPDQWQYFQDIGFVHYWWTGDYTKAAAAFSKGAAVPGSPWWMQSLAAVTLAEGGDRKTSRLLWRALAQTPDNDFLRRDAQRRLVQLDALDQVDQLQALLARARLGGLTAPWSWVQLLQAGILTTIPIDPTGVPYAIDMNSGRVDVGRQSPLWPLPAEPRGLSAARKAIQ